MSGGTMSTSETRIEALTLQSSAQGVVIPKAYGLCRIPGNLVWYGGFKAVPHTTSQGGKGGVKLQNTSYSYTASVMMGLCRGPISNVLTVWRGKQKYTAGYVPSQINTVTESYTVTGTLTYTVAHASGFLAVCSVRYTYYQLTSSGPVARTGTMSNGSDYSVSAAGVLTFQPRFNTVAITVEYQYAVGAPTAPPLGLTLAAGTIGQATWTPLTTYVPAGGAAGDNAVGYSGLAYVAASDYDLGTGAQVENHTFEVQAPMAYHLGSSIPDVDPSKVLLDILSDSTSGAAFPAVQLDVWSDWSNFCVANDLLISPAMDQQQKAADIVTQMALLTNTGAVWSEGRLKMIPYSDASATAHGQTYTPASTPVYELDADCWVDDGTQLKVIGKLQADRFNHVRVEYLDRLNQYNPAIAEAKDQVDIDLYGLRSQDVVQAHWICTAPAARQVAQLLLQRSLYVALKYEATLPWHFAFLEPMDLVTLTSGYLDGTYFSTGVGVFKRAARVLSIEEGADGDLKCSFEDYPGAISSAAVYGYQVPSGYKPDYTAAPGSVSAPVIFEAPAAHTLTGLRLYTAVRGAGSMWGGCHVYVSLDGSTYSQIATVYGGARYGTLSAAASAGASTIAVQGLGAPLNNASSADATALNSLCYVGGSNPEYLAHTTASLTGTGAYTLTIPVHGAYGSAIGAHASGDSFVRIDERIAKSDDIDISYVGKTVYFKFCSFNIFGLAVEDISTVTAYSYAVTGFGAKLQGPITTAQLASGAASSSTFAFTVGYVDFVPSVGPGPGVDVMGQTRTVALSAGCAAVGVSASCNLSYAISSSSGSARLTVTAYLYRDYPTVLLRQLVVLDTMLPTGAVSLLAPVSIADVIDAAPPVTTGAYKLVFQYATTGTITGLTLGAQSTLLTVKEFKR